MPVKQIATLYLIILAPIVALYIFTLLYVSMSSFPTPTVDNAPGFFLDLIKIIVGGAIGAFSATINKGESQPRSKVK
ncbi:hypothetical protein EFD56_27910 [Rhizobium phaseoli]|nr:hypothetical protein EFD56_27910 [Rhizobium phaseoli]